ncbi:hypothetical protein H6P81_007809 [Aristolochia fimbriata]|uniref:Uncharacterized protein n=1 Tax=Aristolochia fimbriata TaxID=158543 RepID=A0AAV7F198_ARIFI|nr:hypothetical protein H6P81_007809 [Aristolochia fimbriata]
MDANVPKSQPPVLPGQATAGYWSTTQTMIDDEEDEMGLLWEVRVPDLSVLHSMPMGEPFSHEGNALFELLERFKQQQQQQASAAKARRRARKENAARALKQVAQTPSTATAANINNTMDSLDSDDEASMTMDFLLDIPYNEGDEIDSSKANKSNAPM